MSHFPEMFSISNVGRLEKMDPREYDLDPRGIVWMFEPPNKGAQYCCGVDPTVGRTGWTRYSRVKEDMRTNNGAIEILKIGKNGAKDVQVAEYAAPIDAFDLAYVINVLARIYAGIEEDMCKIIIEVFPGPGAGTLQQCLELGATNLFHWEMYGNTAATPTRAMGWHASPRTNRDLWVKAARHMVLQNVIIKSPWLVEELADCRLNLEKDYAENPGGLDDRVRAFSLALWVANSWSVNIERTTEKISTVPEVDWQKSDLSLDEIHEGWNTMLDRLS